MIKLVCFALLAFAACGGTPTGSSCPPVNPPTWDGFGLPFFIKYCEGCHARTVANRHGAPGDQVFDNEPEIVAHAAEIDEVAAAGPHARNDVMPDLSGPVRMPPSDAERFRLGEFLACATR